MQLVQSIQEAFGGVDCLYIADGHHRAASAARCVLNSRRVLAIEVDSLLHVCDIQVLSAIQVSTWKGDIPEC